MEFSGARGGVKCFLKAGGSSVRRRWYWDKMPSDHVREASSRNAFNTLFTADIPQTGAAAIAPNGRLMATEGYYLARHTGRDVSQTRRYSGFPSLSSMARTLAG